MFLRILLYLGSPGEPTSFVFLGFSRKLTRTGSIWLGLGRYLHRIDPAGSGMPLGCLLDPQPHKKFKNPRFPEFRGSGGQGHLFPLFALKGCGQILQ